MNVEVVTTAAEEVAGVSVQEEGARPRTTDKAPNQRIHQSSNAPSRPAPKTQHSVAPAFHSLSNAWKKRDQFFQ
jgi:hypothetical protein